MHENHVDEKSTLVNVMAWCRQATSQYNTWPPSMSPYDATILQWFNLYLNHEFYRRFADSMQEKFEIFKFM